MKLLVAISAILFGLVAAPALAAEFRVPKNDGLITIDSGETAKDLYTVGQTIQVKTTILGDLVTAGNQIILDGAIKESLFAAGQTVAIRGGVGRHVRIAGAFLTLTSLVKGDFLAAGEEITIEPTGLIEGDLLAAGKTVTVNGPVGGRIRVTAEKVIINGPVHNVSIDADKVELGDQAIITGDFHYRSPEMASVSSTAKITGTTDYKQVKRSSDGLKQFVGVGNLLHLIGIFLLGWLLIARWPKTLRQMTNLVTISPWRTLGFGLLTLFVVPILGIILMITLIGLPIALALLFAWLFILMLGSVIGKVAFGLWLMKLLTREPNQALDIQTAIAGILVLAVVMFIPLLGPLVNAVVFLLGIGAVSYFVLNHPDSSAPNSDGFDAPASPKSQ